MFCTASLKRIYTVLVQSPVTNVYGILAEHPVQFVGVAPVPNATCTPEETESVGQTVFNVTAVVFVPVALLLIENDHPVGAVLSCVLDVTALHTVVLVKLSLALTK